MDAPSIRLPIWKSVYFLALLLVATPFVDLVTQVGNIRPGDLVWRYGFLGFFANNLLTPLLGLTLAAVAAAMLGHRRLLRTLNFFCVLFALLLIGFAGIFSLDVLQVRSGVEPAAANAFKLGALIALSKYLAGAAGLLFLAWTGRRTIAGWQASPTRTGSSGSRNSTTLVRPAPAAPPPLIKKPARDE
jgi:hypothetical protein